MIVQRTLVLLFVGQVASGSEPIACHGFKSMPSLAGVHFTIVTVEDWPFINVREDCAKEQLKSCAIQHWTEWDGWIVEVIQTLSSCSGFTYTLQLPSNGDTYGAADKDVWHQAGNYSSVRGANDPGLAPTIMFAGAYITPMRLNWTSITAPYSRSPLSLLVKVPEATTNSHKFTQPFTWPLWYMIVGMIGWTALLFVLFDGGSNESPVFRGKAFDNLYSFFMSYCQSVYLFSGALSGRAGAVPYSRLASALIVCYGLMTMMVMTCYMGSATAVFVAGTLEEFPRTFSDFLSAKYKTCVLKDSAYAKFLRSQPKYAYLSQVPISGLNEMATALAEGRCDGVVERQMHMEYLEAAAATYKLTRSAEKANGLRLQVFETLNDGPQDLSVMVNSAEHTPDVIRRLSLWITALVDDGTISDLYNAKVLLGSSESADAVRVTQGEQQITIEEFSSLFTALGLTAVVVAACQWLSRLMFHRKWAQSRHKDLLDEFLLGMVARKTVYQPEWALQRAADVDLLVHRWARTIALGTCKNCIPCSRTIYFLSKI
jgi:ABC-type amino acid transport substrate-binding protein